MDLGDVLVQELLDPKYLRLMPIRRLFPVGFARRKQRQSVVPRQKIHHLAGDEFLYLREVLEASIMIPTHDLVKVLYVAQHHAGEFSDGRIHVAGDGDVDYEKAAAHSGEIGRSDDR